MNARVNVCKEHGSQIMYRTLTNPEGLGSCDGACDAPDLQLWPLCAIGADWT